LTAQDVRRLVSSKPAGSRGLAFVFDTRQWPAGESGASPAELPAESAVAALRAGGWGALVARRGDDPAVLWRAGLSAGLGAGAFDGRKVS
jgi:hypothetical protein